MDKTGTCHNNYATIWYTFKEIEMIQDDLMFRITPREKTLLDLLMVVIEERAGHVFELKYAQKITSPPVLICEDKYCRACGRKK